MTTCGCAPGTLTSFAFSNGVVLRRCLVHEVQIWTRGDEAADRAPLPALKDLFVQERGGRKRSAQAPPVQVRSMQARPVQAPTPTDRAQRPPAPTDVVLSDDAPTDNLLTALLNAHGLTGAWSVA